jgi:hypothetical protein
LDSLEKLVGLLLIFVVNAAKFIANSSVFVIRPFAESERRRKGTWANLAKGRA